MTLPMAIVDYIPVILFLMAAMTLLHDLYHMMSKGAFALLAAGLIVISVAGFYKATWKLLYALNICDFAALNTSFFPMQATGFMLGGIGMLALLFFPQKKGAYVAAAPAVFNGTMIFVVFTILGTCSIWGGLAAIAAKMKKNNIVILLLVSLFCMLGMGYLSSHDFTKASMNWIAQGTNIFGQGTLLWGTWLMHRAGLEKLELKK